VLLYFSPTRIPEVVRRFYRALVDGGQLVLGAVEASQVVTPELTFVAAPGVALYRKDGRTGEAKLETGTSKLEAQKLGILIAEGARTPGAAFKVSRHNVPVSRPKPTSTAKRSSSGPPAETPPSLYAAGRYREACQMLLAEADRAKGRDPQSAVLLAQCYASLGELAEALVWCERALAIARTDPALHFLHAGILQELSRDDESQRALRNVLYLDPGHVAAHYAMANLHRRGNRLPAATRHLANVRQLLAGRDESEELPQSGGLTVGRLNAIMNATLGLTGTKNGKTHE
jgi:chemotaxis protein methyltransferase CheR